MFQKPIAFYKLTGYKKHKWCTNKHNLLNISAMMVKCGDLKLSKIDIKWYFEH